MKVYLVIADYESEVSYGIDQSSHLCGIYETKEEAQKRIDYLAPIIEECHSKIKECDNKEPIYEKYDKITGLYLEPYDYFSDVWGVELKIIKITVGEDLKNVLLGGAAYAE